MGAPYEVYGVEYTTGIEDKERFHRNLKAYLVDGLTPGKDLSYMPSAPDDCEIDIHVLIAIAT